MAYSITDCFMISFAAGLVFAVVYEALRVVRVVLPFRAVIFLCDVLFFVLAAFAVTKISVSLGNHIRIYTVLGFGAGIFTYITTVGRLLNIAENAVSGAVRRVLSAFFRKIGSGLSKIFGAIVHTSKDTFGKINKIRSSAMQKLHKPLQKSTSLLYNIKRHKASNGGSESGHVIKAKVTRSNNT